MGVTSNSMLRFGTPPEVENTDVRALLRWLQQSVFPQFYQRVNVTDELWLHQSYAAPKRPRPGLCVYADGTRWNPGSGEGVYVYKSTGWKFIA